ncbi:hypothetical protein P152DRAFT_429536 [Eremomyces bilateralis CBS 781.70]|uniref:Uncharacterized protein n=1 Tax=Eremomyces bilateralis CBS 781.70 TaxID=1392243 RepID=A0A6G1GBL5_9PEZI|nr:uncharacterized protein P152DRAFT_429536 [Eremomyces bilateralis CBS 781.70]KAF1815488.1 hypothetical protein P152DRAFT_429536 [Eremomyces bilateralis CBS 781.70]
MIISSHPRSPRSDMHSRKPTHLSISSTSSLSPRLGVPLNRPLLSPRTPSSPSLPSLIPRHGKRTPLRSSRLVWKLLFPLLGIILVLWGALHILAYGPRLFSQSPPQGSNTLPQLRPPRPRPGEAGYEIVGEDAPPDYPTALIVHDKAGRPSWTISIPEQYDFPLEQNWYHELCEQAHDMPHHLSRVAKGRVDHEPGQPDKPERGLTGMMKLRKKRHGYYQTDKFFIDIDEAEREGLLPQVGEAQEALVEDEGSENLKVCKRSLTYVLESTDAGFGKALMGLWMAYGLAEKEKRAFFVDDTRWAYGNYTTYFQDPPPPSCLPPPSHHRLPCPYSARHKVISSATHSFAFGHHFIEAFEDPKGMGTARQKNIFALARRGYEALFKLADEGDQKYADQRVKQLVDQTRKEGGMAVGMHIRRGDRHPYESQYRDDYLPLTRYTDEGREAVFRATHGKRHGAPGLSESKLILASDDPDIFFEPEVSRATRAQDRIILGSKIQMEAARAKAAAEAAAANRGKPATPIKRWVDDMLGWEGGFYADVFWSLDDPSKLASNNGGHSDVNSPGSSLSNAGISDYIPPSQETLQLREMLARSYLLDLSILSKCDAVVCAVSSAGCRLLGVMVGWEGMLGKEGLGWDGHVWRNVDAGIPDWRGIVW